MERILPRRLRRRLPLTVLVVALMASAPRAEQAQKAPAPASATTASLPTDPMRSSKLVDGAVWDGKDPKKYADGFAVRAAAA